MVYSLNTQYAGNTIGLKKLALRLAINKASKEGWLAEHMFVMGVDGTDNRRTYFSGAFPSSCGKTSTCMVTGEHIVGDDIAYLRKKNGKLFGVNVERGIFGIIKDVNSQDDPLISKVLHSPGEVIFTNILTKDQKPFWQGNGLAEPDCGLNFSGEWTKGKTDENGKLIPFAHPNARYTIPIRTLGNCDSNLENSEGVEIKGIIYGGRDSDTWPPVFLSFDWAHGVITIASSLESETTSATLGEEGIRKFNLMANLDFLSMPMGNYIQNYLNFSQGLDVVPAVFGVNYFIRGNNGEYLTDKQDKRVWLKWMELKIHGEVAVIKSPIGFLPVYEDLQKLFKQVLDQDYSKEMYNQQFMLRVSENIKKVERIVEIYRGTVTDVPEVLFGVLDEQRIRLKNALEKYGAYILPEQFSI
ncbi:MAG: hypothetical protein DRP78_07440 [Candidatus Omnitrophota bacterium]|nr:MAG: hypothetical protein DRP78_07440 [Candidatus Omnitrophota bacterium]